MSVADGGHDLCANAGDDATMAPSELVLKLAVANVCKNKTMRTPAGTGGRVDYESVLRTAHRGTGRSGLDGTHRQLQMMCGVAGALQHGQDIALKRDLKMIEILGTPFVLHRLGRWHLYTIHRHRSTATTTRGSVAPRQVFLCHTWSPQKV